MGTPVPVTGPAGPVVSVEELKVHLRVDSDDEDDLIESLEAAAVALLDGWHGVLGRAIDEQVWRQEFTSAEPLRLALPDVSEIDVTAHNPEGDVVTIGATLKEDDRGFYIEASGTWSTLSVDYTCALPARRRPAVVAAIKMLVGHWYAHREAVLVGTISGTLPLAVDALLAPLRWRML